MFHKGLGKALNSLFTWDSLRQIIIASAIMGFALTLGADLVHAADSGLIGPDNPKNISDATGGEVSARALARTIVNFFLFFLGLVATIMVIYGGVLYVTAAGNDDQVGKAKNVILYAIIGIVVILLSFALVNTVILGAGTSTEPATAATNANA